MWLIKNLRFFSAVLVIFVQFNEGPIMLCAVSGLFHSTIIYKWIFFCFREKKTFLRLLRSCVPSSDINLALFCALQAFHFQKHAGKPKPRGRSGRVPGPGHRRTQHRPSALWARQEVPAHLQGAWPGEKGEHVDPGAARTSHNWMWQAAVTVQKARCCSPSSVLSDKTACRSLLVPSCSTPNWWTPSSGRTWPVPPSSLSSSASSRSSLCPGEQTLARNRPQLNLQQRWRNQAPVVFPTEDLKDMKSSVSFMLTTC